MYLIHQVERASLTASEIRDLARKTALEAIGIQKDEFREMGIMADWEGSKGTYRTLGMVKLDLSSCAEPRS